MKKVLIISYRFPPADETGTQRTWALAKYMKGMGYYPIFVTRNWSRPLKSIQDMFVPVGEIIEHEKNENYEVYILPHRDSLKNRLNIKFKTKYTFIRKIYNMLDFILMYFGFFKLNEFEAFNKQAHKIAEADRSIRKAIVIADPFPLFYIGYSLFKRFHINWIADYRDDWNTRAINDTFGFKKTKFHEIVEWFTIKSEKKWVGTASYITSVSDEYTDKIASFVNVKGSTIYNGFFEEGYQPYKLLKPNFATDSTGKKKFVIVHNGTMYPTQDISIFLQGYKKIIDLYKDHVSFSTKFIGIIYKVGAKERIDEIMEGYSDYYECTPRVDRQILFSEMAKANLALMISHGKTYKGVTSSKIFDYLALEKTVLCCPPDGDIVESILSESNLGIFCETSEDVFNALAEQVKQLLFGKIKEREINHLMISKFSRKTQTQKVVDILDEI